MLDKRTKTKIAIPDRDITQTETEGKGTQKLVEWKGVKNAKTKKGTQKVQNNPHQKRGQSRLLAVTAVIPTSKFTSYGDIHKNLKSRVRVGAIGMNECQQNSKKSERRGPDRDRKWLCKSRGCEKMH